MYNHPVLWFQWFSWMLMVAFFIIQKKTFLKKERKKNLKLFLRWRSYLILRQKIMPLWFLVQLRTSSFPDSLGREDFLFNSLFVPVPVLQQWVRTRTLWKLAWMPRETLWEHKQDAGTWSKATIIMHISPTIKEQKAGSRGLIVHECVYCTHILTHLTFGWYFYTEGQTSTLV